MGSLQVFSELLQPRRRPQGKPEKLVLSNEKHSSATLHASVGKCKSTHFCFWGQLQIKGSPGKVTPQCAWLSFPIAIFSLATCSAGGGSRGGGDREGLVDGRHRWDRSCRAVRDRGSRGEGVCEFACGGDSVERGGATSSWVSVSHWLLLTLNKGWPS